MAYVVVPASAGNVGKFVMWKGVRPTLAEVLEAKRQEFPDTPESKLRIDHGLYVSLTDSDGLPKFS